jgi:23S rRNA pseudouridine1911/1915/1917 synthase
MGDRQEYRIVSNSALLAFLLGPPLSLSRKQAKDLLRFDRVAVRGKTHICHDTPLDPGDTVEILSRARPADRSLERAGLRILHLDEAIVVIDKPAGLLSMGSEREKANTTHRLLNDHLKMISRSRRQQIFIVHRLDRETSGLMVFARSESIQAALQGNWKDITKRYLAIVEGVPADPEGTLRDHLIESKSLKVHRVERGGALAITHYRLIRNNGARSMLELTLETGRKHQIRVQLAAFGHSIIGDQKYGAKNATAGRLALHSCELQFRHPVSGAAMQFRSELPRSLLPLIEGHRRG